MSEHARQVLVFEVGGGRFALPASAVQELVRAVTIVSLPLAPAIVEGVVNLRGRVVPVLDIRARLELPSKPVEPSDHLIMACSRGRLVALRVDRALELVTLETNGDGESRGMSRALPPTPSGVVRLRDGLAPLLDLDVLLTPAEAEALSRLVTESESPLEREETP